MYNIDELPEVYVSDDGQRITAPTYEATAQCHMVMTSAETGQRGPTLVEPGEHFTSNELPNHQWRPLNKAAGERMEAWLASLPVKGDGIPQEIITQAAFMMRPRDGEPDVPHDQWWPMVLRLAGQLYEKSKGARMPSVGATVFRPGATGQPVMPFAGSTPLTPLEPGRAPVSGAEHIPQSPGAAANRVRRGRVTPPMPGTLPSESPQSSAG